MQRPLVAILALGVLAWASLGLAQPLQFWKFGTPEETANITLQSWIDEWNEANPDTLVEARFIPWADYTGPTLTTAFAAGTGPDVFWVSPGLFMQYVESGIAADLSDLFTPELREDLLPAAVEAVTVDGIPRAMPFEQEPVALFYNPGLLEQVGADVPTTWEELLETAELLVAADIIPIVIEPAQGFYQNFTWYPFLWQTGADVADPDLTEATFDSPGAAQALDLWRTLIQQGFAPRTAPEGTNNVTSTPFASGHAAMQVVGMWAIAPLQADFPELDFAVTHLPAPAGQDFVTVYGGWTQMVNARSANLEGAKRFTEWMWAQDVGRPLEWVTEANTKFSPRQSVTEAGAEFYAQPHLRDFRDEILPTARAEPRFPSEMVWIVSEALQSSMFRNTPGEVAAAAAQRELENYLRTRGN
jgi:multiple sugar transport system substrate-binding protein